MNDDRDPDAADQAEPAAPASAGEVESEDFAIRNAVMSNAFPGQSNVAAGAAVATTGKILEPTVDEERAEGDSEAEAAEDRAG